MTDRKRPGRSHARIAHFLKQRWTLGAARFLRLLVAAIAIGWCGGTFALPQPGPYKYFVSVWPADGPYSGGNPTKRYYPTIEDACDAALAYLKSIYPQYANRTWTRLTCQLSISSDGALFSLNPDPGYKIGHAINRTSPGMCPANSVLIGSACSCRPGYQEDPSNSFCHASAPESQDDSQSCKRTADGVFSGNPIFPASNEKFESQLDWADSGSQALSFIRTYRSSWSADSSRSTAPLGQVWAHNFSTKLTATPNAAPTAVVITTGEGYARGFAQVGGATTWSATNSADTLTPISGGGWAWHRSDDNVTSYFDGSGRLQTTVERN
ncbi:unnamed protein product, partial [Brugia timori]|uniref:DUF6531 domain-containing protein n=1 Tax=Brugia timori TaxID=42155 RepID=A0A0R3QFY4_9BILA